MKYGIVPKVYDIDYSFIIKNYLSPDLWDREWLLYEYKEFKVNLSLYRIDVYDRSIYFKLSFHDIKHDERYSNLIMYYTKQSNINVLKKEIEGGLFNMLKSYEYDMITHSNGYSRLRNSYDDEYDNLRDIAIDFLDQNNVTNEDIRDAYIDSYVGKNSRKSKALDNYVEAKRYCVLSEYFVVLTKTMGDEDRYRTVADKISNTKCEEILAELQKQADIVCEFDDDYREEMEDALEAI